MAKLVQIDAWGRPQYNSNFRNAANHPGAYKVDTATEGVCYICFSADAESAIQRIATADNVTTIEVGFGAWADRATLEYQEIE